jgi:hypothetical protein
MAALSWSLRRTHSSYVAGREGVSDTPVLASLLASAAKRVSDVFRQVWGSPHDPAYL